MVVNLSDISFDDKDYHFKSLYMKALTQYNVTNN